MSGTSGKRAATFWRYRRPFSVDGLQFLVTIRSRGDGLHSQLSMIGVPVAEDHTPVGGPDAVRNHRLQARMPDGRTIEVEAGYISLWNTGIAVWVDGAKVHESHPGRNIAYPPKYRDQIINMPGNTISEAFKAGMKDGSGKAQLDGLDPTAWSRNKIPLSVDIGLGLMFFVVAKLTNLTTAALVGAAVGLVLYAVQRRTRIDLLGGLAAFGIVMMLFSAALALIFQSDDAVKLRTTIVGLTGAAIFLIDGLFGGNRMGKRMAKYLPYTDLMPNRLAIGMGVMGIIMAGLNLLVARLFSTDFWLFYTTFLDFALVMAMIFVVFAFARGKLFPPRRPPPEAAPPPAGAERPGS